MLLATSYPLLDAFWTILEIVVFVLWIWLAISIYADIFRSHDLSGTAKALWVIFVFVLPYLGVFVYLVFRGGQMHERAARANRAGNEALHRFFEQQTGTHLVADELNKLADLRDRGVISADEFEREKTHLLSRS